MENIRDFDFVTFKNGITVVNATPHDIVFMEEDGELVLVPSSLIINAKVEEKVVKFDSGIVFVEPTFVGTEEGAKVIEDLHKLDPNLLIVGSIIAAQAYPGKVVAMTPCKGYERVAPDQKRMSTFKFTMYQKVKGICGFCGKDFGKGLYCQHCGGYGNKF